MNVIIERIAEWFGANGAKIVGVVLFIALGVLREWLKRSEKKDDDE